MDPLALDTLLPLTRRGVGMGVCQYRFIYSPKISTDGVTMMSEQ